MRETFRAWCVDGTDTIEDGYRHVRYKADGVERKTETIWDLDCNEGPFEAGLNEEPSKWIPSIHMPRWASRITLRITGVRVEKLQDISEKDAIAEGIEWDETHNGFRGQIRHRGMSTWHSRASEAFGFFWDTLNSKEGYRWKDNPWVWVVSFERIEK
ncbi:hypothetical protein LJC41_02590 [Desulfosarcina sp. OttesenSCG-928-G17]|nr:hypothetical protein [Desulfosarcina sp. OttesenSCG-928-G17]